MKCCAQALTIVCACLLIWGCAAPDVQQDESPQPPPIDQRSAELFQKRCDDSMLQAAIARWSEGDISGCQQLLERLLNRNQSNLEARLTLADLQLSQGDVQAAENHLRWIVQQNPQNPQARHSLGMLLDTTGRHEEALGQLREAARLDPQNQLYTMCEQTALGVTDGTTPMATSPRADVANRRPASSISAAHPERLTSAAGR
jgi:tetratricopeptide (TPR) repeat protein